MFRSLPEPDPAVLAGPPASLVVFNLAIEVERELRPSDGVAWHKHLQERGFKGSLLQKVQQQTLTVTGIPALQAPPPQTRDGWKVSGKGQESQATVFDNGCTVERLNYPGFDAFSAEMRAAATALDALLSPSLRTRLGLRYANALSLPEASKPSFWQDKVEAPFLGVGADKRLQDEIEQTFSVVNFREGDIQAQVRSALQPDVVYRGCYAFAFDIEVFDTALTEFSVDSSFARSKDLNRAARQLFQAILTKRFYESFEKAKR